MTPRDRRALALGGLVLAAAMAVRLVTGVAAASGQMGRDREMRAGLVAEARHQVEGFSRLEDSAVAVRRAFVSLAPQLLEASTVADALTELSRRLTVAARQVGAGLEALTPEADSSRQGQVRRISMRIAFTAGTHGAVKLLAALAAGPVVLTPEWVQIVAVDPFASPTTAEQVRVELITSAWFLEGTQ